MKRCTQCGERKVLSDFYKKKAECRSCSSKRAVAWAKRNRLRTNRNAAKWRKKNHAKVLDYARKHSRKQKQLCMHHYGRKGCVCCGERELSFLTLDHIKDNGKQNRPGRRIKYQMLISLKFPKGLQTLCFNCQWGKRIGKGFCPHHPRKDLRCSKPV